MKKQTKPEHSPIVVMVRFFFYVVICAVLFGVSAYLMGWRPSFLKQVMVANEPDETVTPAAPVQVSAPVSPVKTVATVPSVSLMELDSLGKNGQFIMALTRDRLGNVWVGTEDEGVFRCTAQPNGTALVTQFTTAKGLGDNNAYAITCDKLGRVWVGHLNHGVSVFNGEKWRNYDVTEGPLGERVFCMATCPTDGDVWIGTSAGLARYSQAKDRWHYYTRAEGLPSDQISAIAFDVRGNIVVGTQCDGVAMARVSNDYATWHAVAGMEKAPIEPCGVGLPANLINDVLVGRDGTIWAATSIGVAWSEDEGKTWSYRRGRDYADKVKNRRGGTPQSWMPVGKTVMESLLPEDYVTRLAEDAEGNVWLGFRQQGCGKLEAKTRRMIYHGTRRTATVPDDYVSALLATPSGVYAGTYGKGCSSKIKTAKGTPMVLAASHSPIPFPSPASAPTPEELQKMTAMIKAMPTNQVTAVYRGEDWKTAGDWVGRYGRQYAVLCAAASPWNHPFPSARTGYAVRAQLGPGFTKNDALRHWIEWLKTDNPRTLYDPKLGCRRQAEWDDHGETYRRFIEGPDIWVTVKVPEGIHRVSLYFFNKDGQSGANRLRDYLVELKPYVEKIGDDPLQRKGLSPPSRQSPLEDLEAAEKLPTLARARVRDFWGGVYEQFLVHGPNKYLIKVAKNHSYNTVCSGVMIDNLTGIPPEKDGKPMNSMIRTLYRPPVPEVDRTSASARLQASLELWDTINQNCASMVQYPFQMAAYRAALAENAPFSLLENWRWKLLIWRSEDRAEFQRKVKQGWHEFLVQNPHLLQYGYKE